MGVKGCEASVCDDGKVVCEFFSSFNVFLCIFGRWRDCFIVCVCGNLCFMSIF